MLTFIVSVVFVAAAYVIAGLNVQNLTTALYGMSLVNPNKPGESIANLSASVFGDDGKDSSKFNTLLQASQADKYLTIGVGVVSILCFLVSLEIPGSFLIKIMGAIIMFVGLHGASLYFDKLRATELRNAVLKVFPDCPSGIRKLLDSFVQ